MQHAGQGKQLTGLLTTFCSWQNATTWLPTPSICLVLFALQLQHQG